MRTTRPSEHAGIREGSQLARPSDDGFQLEQIMQVRAGPPVALFVRSLRTLLASTLLIAISCDRAVQPAQRTPARVTADLLTGDALAALGSDGRFHIPPALAESTVPALSREGAERIAVQYWRTFGLNDRFRLAERRGAPIDPNRLAPCGTTVLAESPWESPPPGELSHYRAFIGPQWIVPFCDGSDAQIIVAVAALAAGLEPTTTFVSSTRFMNSAISVEGVPPGTQLALSPEEAVLAVARAAGTRVAKVPRLMRADPPWAATWAMWTVELERPVRAVGSQSGATRQHAVLLYGQLPAEKWRTAIAANPSPITPAASKEITDDLSTVGRGIQRVVLHRRAVAGFAGAEAVQVSGGTAP